MNLAQIEIGARLMVHVWKNRMKGRQRYPIVTMLEPLETCNLTCKGCGRIREYRDNVILKKKMVSVDRCLEVVSQADSPIVSIAGGEPLIHPQIDEIVNGIIAQRRFVFLCTNGLLMEKAMAKIKPSRYFSWVVHLDGMPETHDYWVERKGTWEKAMGALKLALEKGYRVCTNTTIFEGSDVDDLHRLFQTLTDLGVEGLMISAGYPYQSVPDRDIFLQRQRSIQAFRKVLDPGRKFRYYNNPLYLDFLRGDREAPCRAWTNPTYTPVGWRVPCYLLADDHTERLEDVLDPGVWERYGLGKDPRCASCTMHSGYEAGMIQEAFTSGSSLGALVGRYLKQPRRSPAQLEY